MISNGERCDSLGKHVTSSPKPSGSISAQVEPETPVIPDKLCDKEFTLSGAGGSRTRVQTRTTRAFYMFILQLIFDRRLITDNPPSSLVQ